MSDIRFQPLARKKKWILFSEKLMFVACADVLANLEREEPTDRLGVVAPRSVLFLVKLLVMVFFLVKLLVFFFFLGFGPLSIGEKKQIG